MSKKNKNAERDAYEKIKRAILLKRLLPGQQLAEEWLSENLNISRTPVRIALKKLEDERLIKIIPKRGAFVHQPCIQEIQDVFDVRIVLEGFAAKKAASLINDVDIKNLNNLLREEKKAYETKTFEDFIKVNEAIHIYPAKITKNKALISQINTLLSWSNCYVALKDPFYSRSVTTAKNIHEHECIVESLSKKEASKSEKAVRYHLESTADGLKAPVNIFDEN